MGATSLGVTEEITQIKFILPFNTWVQILSLFCVI
jgi:hypothetical protein